MYLDYCRPRYWISLYVSYISENLKICYSHAINLKFGQDRTIDKRNVSSKFHQNPTMGRYLSKICLQMRPEFTSKYWQNFKKHLPHAGFRWNWQETFLLSIVWSCPNFKLIAWLLMIADDHSHLLPPKTWHFQWSLFHSILGLSYSPLKTTNPPLAICPP